MSGILEQQSRIYMTILTGTFVTAQASKYLQQLCKHFAHKIEVTSTDTTGTCHFVMGPAYLTAHDTQLEVQFDLTGADQADRAKHVMDSHLQRFAFRENFTAMEWHLSDDG
mgnify:FL=1